MPLFPDSIVMVPKHLTRDEVSNRVAGAIRLEDYEDGVGSVSEENFLKTVKPHASRAMVIMLASHYVRIFEEVG